MFRLQIMYGKTWKWGVRTYNSLEEATARVETLASVGIKARVRYEKALAN